MTFSNAGPGLPNFFVQRSTEGEFWTDERCYITELHNHEMSPEASLAVARVEPGVTTQLHRLDGVCERYIVQQGTGVLEVDGVKQTLNVGDQAVIPDGASQRIENTGTTDLLFYCLCTPRFLPESYVNLED